MPGNPNGDWPRQPTLSVPQLGCRLRFFGFGWETAVPCVLHLPFGICLSAFASSCLHLPLSICFQLLRFFRAFALAFCLHLPFSSCVHLTFSFCAFLYTQFSECALQFLCILGYPMIGKLCHFRLVFPFLELKSWAELSEYLGAAKGREAKGFFFACSHFLPSLELALFWPAL